MKLSKKLILCIVALIVSLSTLTGFTFAANEDNAEYELGVMLKQDESNEKVVHVILGMTDEDSVASFQLGLEIDVAEEVNAKFAFDSELPKSEHQSSNFSDLSNSENKKTKRLNIYYTGTNELNPVDSNEVEIGTITFEEANQANTTIVIKPIENFSTVESISHKDTLISVSTLDTVVNKQVINPGGDTGNQGGDNNNPGNGNNGNSAQTGDTGSGNGSGNNDGNTGNSGNWLNNFIKPVQTGEDRSMTWVKIALVLLIVVVVAIIKLKVDLKRKQKNAK